MSLTNRLKILLSASVLLCGFAGTAQQVKYNDSFTLYVITPKETTDKVWLKGRYKDSQPDGRWEFYEFDGYLSQVQQYKNGMLNDTFYYYNNKGEILAKGNYKNNKKSGPWHEGYETGNYVDGLKQGWWGASYRQTYYVDGRANGSHYKFSMGDTSVWGQYVNDSREGKWVINDDSYLGDCILYFKNNMLEDTAYRLYSNGKIREKTVYREGKKNGPSIEYDGRAEEGIFSCDYCLHIINYKDNWKNGAEYITTPNGDTLMYRMNGSNGENQEIFWNNKGIKRKEHWYNVGPARVDSIIEWNDKGRLAEYYKGHNRLEAQPGDVRKKWDSTGRLTYLDTFYLKNRNRFLDVYAYKTGKMTEERHFMDGKRTGRYYIKGHYELYYDSTGKLLKKVLENRGKPSDYDTPEEYANPDGNYYYRFEKFEPHIREYSMDEIMDMPVAAPPVEEPDFGNRFDGRTMEARLETFKGDTLYYQKYPYGRSSTVISQGLKGTVKLKLWVAQDGMPFGGTITKSGGPLLDGEALRIMLRTYWTARRDKGVIIPSWREVTVIF